MAKNPQSRRVKTPTVLQMEAAECGAAALASVLGYYGLFIPLEQLRIECGVSRDGSKASNVLKAARKFGMMAKGFRKELDGLLEVELPVILFWNMNHFVVLEGIRKGKVYINDPAEGPRVVSMEELDTSFSGVVLTFQPGEDFAPRGRPSRMLPALRDRLSGSESALTFVILCGLFLVLPGLVVPTFMRVFIDEILIGTRQEILRPLLVGMVITAGIQMSLTALQERYLLRMETKLALVASSRFFLHVLRLPMSYFAQRFAGEIGSRVQINDKVASMVSGRLASVALDSVLIVFYAALMFLYDVSLTGVVIALGLINVLVLRWAGKWRTDVSRRMVQESGKLMGTAINGLAMIETLKATGSETEFFSRWAGYQAKALKAEQELGLIGEYVGSVPPLVRTLASTAVLLLGGLEVMKGGLTIGMLVAYQSLLGSFMRPLETMVGFGGSIQELEADMARLDDVLRHHEDPSLSVETPEGRGMLKLSGRLEIEGLTFGYSPLDEPLIQDFSLSLAPGQRVALVGASGSGKSTVARLVCGLLEPWSGRILFDGIERRRLDPKLISNSLAVVDQDIFLFEGTIRENLTLWDLTVPVLNVTRACRDAEIDDVVQTRDGAHQAKVSEGGGNYSGGQRQRLEIARALVGDPTLLILDEATSALDPKTELAIDDHLRRRGCTCLIVAHRLSTIRDCDEIIVMDRGRIVQRGTHEEMKDAEGPYAFLIQG